MLRPAITVIPLSINSCSFLAINIIGEVIRSLYEAACRGHDRIPARSLSHCGGQTYRISTRCRLLDSAHLLLSMMLELTEEYG